MRAIIVGAGIAGTAAAIALRRAGCQVSVHERAEAITPLGAALSIWPNAVAALERLGVLGPVADAGAPIRTLLLADKAGRAMIGPQVVERPTYLGHAGAVAGDAVGSAWR